MPAYWDIKTKDIDVDKLTYSGMEGKSPREVAQSFLDCLAKVPSEFHDTCLVRVDEDYDYGATGITVYYTRPKTQDELDADERGRVRSLNDEVARTRHNYEVALEKANRK